MTEPPTLPTVHQCITRAMALVRPVGKEGVNKQDGYQFKRIDDFMTAANRAMAEAGVHQVPRVLTRITDETHLTSRQNVMRWVDLEVEFTFYGPAGDSITCVTWGEGRDASDKATNKALTAAQKYALMYVLMVPTSDIQDADRDSPESGETQQSQGGQSDPPPMSDHLRLQYKIKEIADRKSLTKGEVVDDFDRWREMLGEPASTMGQSDVVTLQAFIAHLTAEKPPAQIPGQDELPTGEPDEVADGLPVADGVAVDPGPPSDHPDPNSTDARMERARVRNAAHQ